MAFAPIAEAQFFNWFNPAPAPKPRVRPKPPGDDLPPIVPRESAAPPPPDDRPYDGKLMRLAEILGAVVLAGELSLMAAFTSNDLARAHEKLGRGEILNRPLST